MPNQNFSNRFSETAQKILRDSEVIASTDAAGVDTHHLLSALANTPGTYSYELLRQRNVTPERIAIALGSQAELVRVAGIQPELRQVLKVAYAKATYYHTPTVDSEHILLSIVCTKECLANQLLKKMEADPIQLQDHLEDYFEQIHDAVINHENHNDDTLSEMDENDDHFATPISPEPGRTPARPKTAIEYFTTDLTKLAKAGKLDPVVGRTKETRRLIQILIRRVKNNPVLTGEPGVGKTAIVEGLASKIAAGDVPSALADRKSVV